jgi:Protein of unknown function (DUF3223)
VPVSTVSKSAKTYSTSKTFFWCVRTDGSETDFSYRRCVSGVEPSHRAQVLATMRSAITDQILDYKHNALTPDARCSLTGVPLDEATVHVDHDPPFIEIARAFLDSAGGVEAVKLSPPKDGILGRTFLDPVMAQRWGDFHRTRATLFLTTAEANMSRGAKKTFIRRTARDGGEEDSIAQEDKQK